MNRCLVADDNPDLRSALRLVLETCFNQIEVSEAADRAQLLDRLAATPPDCLILDWELPGPATADFVEGLRQIAPAMRLIVISARPEAAAAALAAHAHAFVAKTDSPDALLAALQHGDG
jgi:CheY-like chemotaxis protein